MRNYGFCGATEILVPAVANPPRSALMRTYHSDKFGRHPYYRFTGGGKSVIKGGSYPVASQSCVLDDKLSKAIDQLEKSGLLKDELAEYRSIETRYGGATANVAAELLIAMWTEVL